MVDDINFPKGLPPVPTSGRVQKVNRKKREEEKPPFEKFLNEKDQKELKRRKKEKKNPTKWIFWVSPKIAGPKILLNPPVRPTPSKQKTILIRK